MPERIVLLFRDLVTQPKQTINFHKELIVEHGSCWWGWWKKPIEDVPVELLTDLVKSAKARSDDFAILFDCGTHELHRAQLRDIAVAPSDAGMLSPAMEKTPAYYQHLMCAVWFNFVDIAKIENVPERLKKASYLTFPTWRNVRYDAYKGKEISGLEEMDEMLVTMWHVQWPE